MWDNEIQKRIDNTIITIKETPALTPEFELHKTKMIEAAEKIKSRIIFGAINIICNDITAKANYPKSVDPVIMTAINYQMLRNDMIAHGMDDDSASMKAYKLLGINT